MLLKSQDFATQGSLSYKKKGMQYLGIVLLLTGGNFQIQQPSASGLSQFLGYLHRVSYSLHRFFCLFLDEQRQSLDPSYTYTPLHKTSSILSPNQHCSSAFVWASHKKKMPAIHIHVAKPWASGKALPASKVTESLIIAWNLFSTYRTDLQRQ